MIYNLDVRCYQTLQLIMNQKEYVPIQQLSEDNKISKRSVYYDISKINEWLQAFDIESMEIERSKGVKLSEKQIRNIKEVLNNSSYEIEYLFTPQQREQMIVCSIIIKNKRFYIEDFMELCKVSRNTIINDLKMVVRELAGYGLELTYESKEGYQIQGKFMNKVTLFFLYFNALGDFYRNGIIPLDNKEKIEFIKEKLIKIEHVLETKYVPGTLFTLAVFFASSIDDGIQTWDFSKEDKIEIMNTKEYQLVANYFEEMNLEEQLFLSLHLLGSRLQTVTISILIDNQDTTYELATALVDEFCSIAFIEFPDRQKVINSLFGHLKTSLYRYKYGIQLANPMLDNIKQEYNELFEITKKACQVIQKKLAVPIPDSEVAYITLHFGGFIIGLKEMQLRIVIICPNGVSTSNMLKAEIQLLLPQATVIDNMMLSDFKVNHNYDVVISTIDIKDYPNAIVVHPILTDSDRVMILRRFMNSANRFSLEVDKILKMAEKYIEPKNLISFERELRSYAFNHSSIENRPKNSFGKGILSYLSLDKLQITNENYSWQEAIEFASKPLIESGDIENRYVDSMIEKINLLGNYMFIYEGVVLGHAGIDDGVNQLSFSFTLFKQPIEFSEQKKANIIMILATNDQVSHIRILKDIMVLFKDKDIVNQLINCNHVNELKKSIYHRLIE